MVISAFGVDHGEISKNTENYLLGPISARKGQRRAAFAQDAKSTLGGIAVGTAAGAGVGGAAAAAHKAKQLPKTPHIHAVGGTALRNSAARAARVASRTRAIKGAGKRGAAVGAVAGYVAGVPAGYHRGYKKNKAAGRFNEQ